MVREEGGGSFRLYEVGKADHYSFIGLHAVLVGALNRPTIALDAS